MVGFALVFLGLAFFGYRKMLLSLCCSCFCDISGLFVIWAADIVLINRGIWRGIFAALEVVSAGYLNVVCVSSRYLLVSRFSLAYCRAICFFALVEILLWILILNIYPCVSCVSVFILRLLISNNFLFVSVIPVGASDRLAELLNRTWWQEWGWTRDLTATSSMVPL